MAQSYKHDSLSAISEAEATGETARLFADNRSTMQLPLLTSVWRTLAVVEGGLPAAWQAAKPIFESGLPDVLLTKLRSQGDSANREDTILNTKVQSSLPDYKLHNIPSLL